MLGRDGLRAMISHARLRAAAVPLLVVCFFGMVCACAAAQAVVSPLPASDYSAHAACGPGGPRHARCLSLRLVPETAAARARTHPLGNTRAPRPAESPSPADGSFGLRPQDLHTAYELPSDPPSPQTVAIVDAYNALTAETDLDAYSEEFGLPACTSANGCFTKVNQNGETANLPFPKSKSELEKASKAKREEAEGWGLEISLDIQAVHAVCSGCRVLLVEAKSSSYEDLERAEQTALSLGADEISNSWGGPECFEAGSG